MAQVELEHLLSKISGIQGELGGPGDTRIFPISELQAIKFPQSLKIKTQMSSITSKSNLLNLSTSFPKSKKKETKSPTKMVVISVSFVLVLKSLIFLLMSIFNLAK